MLNAVAPSPYEANRDYVLAVLGRRCRWLDPSEREAIFHDAYAVFLEKQRDGALDVQAMHASQIRAYLTQTALNKALDEGKRAGRRRSVAFEDDVFELPLPEAPADERLADQFENARLREIVAELPERQQVIVKLRFFFEHSPGEIQDFLRVTERVYRRELERAMRTIAERFELVRDGTFCGSRRSLILAYVAGISGPTRAQDARRHLESCPSCARWAVELRETARQAAAFVPFPLLTAHAGADGDGFARVGQAFEAVREHITAVALRADHASSSMFAGVRPGAVAAVLTGCLTVGSTATYCAVEGVPGPLRTALGMSAKRQDAPRPETKRRAPRRLAPAVAPAPVPAPRVKQTRSSSQTSSTSATQRRKAKARAREKAAALEFGPEGSGSSGAPAPAPATSTPAPAATDSGGSTEFGP